MGSERVTAPQEARIEPCPWCGENAEVVGVGYTMPVRGRRVVCTANWSCGVYGPEEKTPEEAIAAWNRVARNAARGAEVQGAMEAWVHIYGADQAGWRAAKIGKGDDDCARCQDCCRVLILPDRSEGRA